MDEKFLHYIWKHRLLSKDLFTSDGRRVTVIRPGEHNADAGPDFTNARIKLDRTTWAGNIEIHVNASDWKKHGHANNKSYDNVILHVVYHADCVMKGGDGGEIPLVDISGKFSRQMYLHYRNFLSSRQWIPCRRQIHRTEKFIMDNWLDRMLAERLERKTESMFITLKQTGLDWEETFYRCLARSFGFKVNAPPFELLAVTLPFKYMKKQSNDLFQLEALLFGQAGMLSGKLSDDYPVMLKREFLFLQNKYGLRPMNGETWKFMRLRPLNFPTLRIAQFASLVHKHRDLFAEMLRLNQRKDFERFFSVNTSAYWGDHYRFDRKSPTRRKAMGKDALHVLLINTVVPFLFLYGRHKGLREYEERSFRLLESLPSEKNGVVNKWKNLGVSSGNAYRSQALLELKNEYCSCKKCLNCAVGNYLLTS